MANIMSDVAAASLVERVLNGDSTQTINFNPDTHTYTVGGEVKRSVTQILKDAGIVSDYSGMDDYYRDRGTAVHHFCTLLAQGWLCWETIEEDSKAYLSQFDSNVTWADCSGFVRTFELIVWELGLSYVSADVLCYDKELDYCGQYDLMMMWDGKRTLVELKTGSAPMWLGLQLAAYERMVDVDDVMGISLKDGKIFVKGDDYEKNHENWKDINTGWFMLDDWKANKKRRHMKVLKGER